MKKLLLATLTTLGMGLKAEVVEPVQIDPNRKVLCTAAQIIPEHADFFSPASSVAIAAGDVMTVDFNQTEITSLNFTNPTPDGFSGGDILQGSGAILRPVHSSASTVGYEATHQSPTSDYIATVTGTISNDAAAFPTRIRIQLLRKRFRAGFGELAGQMSLHEVIANCVPTP